MRLEIVTIVFHDDFDTLSCWNSATMYLCFADTLLLSLEHIFFFSVLGDLYIGIM